MVIQVSGFSLFNEILTLAHAPFLVVGFLILVIRYVQASGTPFRNVDKWQAERGRPTPLHPFALTPLGPNRIWQLIAWASIPTTAIIVAALGYRHQYEPDATAHFLQALSSWAFSIPLSVFLFAILVPRFWLRRSKRMAHHKRVLSNWVFQTYGFTLTPKQQLRLSTWSYSQNHAKSKTTSSVSRTVRIDASDFDRRMMLIVDLEGTPYLGWHGLWEQEFTPLPASDGLRPEKRS